MSAHEHGVSVSALFGSFISAITDKAPAFPHTDTATATARTLKLSSGKIHLPANWDYRDELRDAMTEKYTK